MTASFRSPELPAAKAQYLHREIRSVHGWLIDSTAVYLAAIEVLQRGVVTGDVAEIGVHHGKSFFTLAAGLPEGERAYAVDLFGEQHLNVDRSGLGDRDAFEAHCARIVPGVEVVVIEGSSFSLGDQPDWPSGRRFRLFSVDGGHTAEATANDLAIAEETVVPGAVVALDDILNPHWLGVISGLFDYWAAGGSLVPFALVPNKLLLSTSDEDAARWRATMDKTFSAGVSKSDVPLGSFSIDVYDPRPWDVVGADGSSGVVGSAVDESPALTAPTTAARSDRRRIRRLQAELDAVHASTSWRMTAPMRYVVDRWRDRR